MGLAVSSFRRSDAAPVPGETAIPHLKIHVDGIRDEPVRGAVDALRFRIVRYTRWSATVPHVAFVVPDLNEASSERRSRRADTAHRRRSKVAMIVHDGVPIELMEFETPEKESR